MTKFSEFVAQGRQKLQEFSEAANDLTYLKESITDLVVKGEAVAGLRKANLTDVVFSEELDDETKIYALMYRAADNIGSYFVTLLDTLAKNESAFYKNVHHSNPDDYGFYGINVPVAKSIMDKMGQGVTSDKPTTAKRLNYMFGMLSMRAAQLLQDGEIRREYFARVSQEAGKGDADSKACASTVNMLKQIAAVILLASYRMTRWCPTLVEKRNTAEGLSTLNDWRRDESLPAWVVANSWTDEYLLTNLFSPMPVHEVDHPKKQYLLSLQQNGLKVPEGVMKIASWRNLYAVIS